MLLLLTAAHYRKLLFFCVEKFSSGFGMMKIKSYENCLHSKITVVVSTKWSCKNKNFANQLKI